MPAFLVSFSLVAVNREETSPSVVRIVSCHAVAGDPLLDRLQAALVEHAAVQCGYCSPGMLVSLYHLLRTCRTAGTAPDEHAIREALSGNLCRCTGYVKPVAAAAAVAAALAAGAVDGSTEAR